MKNFGDRLKKVQEENEAFLREEEARQVRFKQDEKTKEDREKAFREDLARSFVDPVLDEINKSVALGKGKVLRKDDGSLRVSLTWNEGKSGKAESGEYIYMDILGNGTLDIRGATTSTQEMLDARIDLLKDEDAKTKIEDRVIDIFKRNQQKYYHSNSDAPGGGI